MILSELLIPVLDYEIDRIRSVGGEPVIYTSSENVLRLCRSICGIPTRFDKYIPDCTYGYVGRYHGADVIILKSNNIDEVIIEDENKGGKYE